MVYQLIDPLAIQLFQYQDDLWVHQVKEDHTDEAEQEH